MLLQHSNGNIPQALQILGGQAPPQQAQQLDAQGIAALNTSRENDEENFFVAAEEEVEEIFAP